ncbi:hypothetical protein HQ544_02370 [Candidatus Falkowbacteria bacterium]|nr:hypothetical protein [Candidatus Falkowbacteria bacterium]
MINKEFFQKLLSNYIAKSSKRHQIIKDSSDALRLSKQAIFAMQRDDLENASNLIIDVEKILGGIKEYFEEDDSLRSQGAYRAALEEYVEAKLFHNVLMGKDIDALENEELTYETYLSAICDVTGELVRKAVTQATKHEFENVEKYRKATEEIIAELLNFNLSGGQLRSKYDDAKRNLRRLEDIMYDVKVKRS